MSPLGSPPPASEDPDDKDIAELIAILEQTPDRDEETIIGNDDYRTVNEMIAHLKEKTPAGMELLALHRRARKKIAEAKAEKDRNPGIIATIRSKIADLFARQ